uniref:Uncharacterized protein n=1 Tax=Physcomitrium patens TaxID=3218 RepID=A0A7I4CJT6_PHYPA
MESASLVTPTDCPWTCIIILLFMA